MMNSKLIFTALILGQSLCLNAQTKPTISVGTPSRLEAVKVTSIESWKNEMPPMGSKNYTALSAIVTSKGCTSASDFKVDVQELKGIKFVSILRTQMDVCSEPVQEIEVQLASPALLKDDHVVILNPFPVLDLGSVY